MKKILFAFVLVFFDSVCSLYAQSNALKWVVDFETYNGSVYDDQQRSISSDVSGNILLTRDNRYLYSIVGDTLYYNITPSGNVTTPSRMDCGTSQVGLCGDINGSKIVHDNSGNVFVSGTYAASVDIHPELNDTFALDYIGAYTNYIAKFNASGIPLWQLSHNYFTTFNVVYDIQTDATGNLYVSGSFRNTADFDPSSSTYNVSTNSPTGDGFLLKLNPSGNLLWVAYLNTPEGSKTRSITMDANGNVNVSVQYWGTAKVYNANNVLVDSLPWVSNNDAAILQFSPQG